MVCMGRKGATKLRKTWNAVAGTHISVEIVSCLLGLPLAYHLIFLREEKGDRVYQRDVSLTEIQRR